MIPSTLRAFALAPVTHLPRRGRTPRLAYASVDAPVRPVSIDAAEAPVILVHEGQGRSHARPIHAIGGRLFTPVMAMRPGEGDAGASPVPRDAADILGSIGSPEGLGWLAIDWEARSALEGTPLMPRGTASDSRFRIGTVGEAGGGTVLSDGRDHARAAMAEFFERDVRVCDGRFLVAMQGPLVVLSRDRWTMTASLNPALVDPKATAIPVFHPLWEALDRVCEMMREGIAKGPIMPIAPALDHVDPNPARPPIDLVSIPRDWEAGRLRAARATALAAPLHALLSTRFILGRLPEGRTEGLRALASEVEAINAWTRLGLYGDRGPGHVLDAALRLVDGAIAADASLMGWAARAFSEQARRHALPRFLEEPPGVDSDALGALAP